ncbi:pyruvate kinase [Marinilabiliaceae bacterium ANBcel2]|nr:pyruvate kinase [Marinilabiliaceae bacterium ANBcel2]
MDKHTKIIATVSDKRCDVEFIRSLYKAGMNVVRMNTAHLDFEGLDKIVNNTRQVSDKIALLIDTKGPEIRTTKCINNLSVKIGDTIILKGSPNEDSTEKCINVSYPKIAEDVEVGSHLLIDDGEVDLIVKEKGADGLICEVLNSGVVGSRKSVNVPGVRINLPSLTQRDISYVKYAIENDIDFIAHSFVRNAQDCIAIQDILDEYDSAVKIIAKIENQEGVENIDDILRHVHGIMVARGDLGIEIPQEKIPLLQRQLIRKCVESKKPVIVATQMLHSMIDNPRPTRAEVTDVANAIYYRTDAIMLSGETAYGKYPVESVATMSKIAKEVEKAKDSRNDIPVDLVKHDITAYLADTAVEASKELNIKTVMTDSLTGKTARYLAAFRGHLSVIALCYNKRVGRELALSYGVFPRLTEAGSSKKEIMHNTLVKLQKKRNLADEDLVAYLGGSFGIGGGTTYLEIITVTGLLNKVDRYVD